MISSMNLRLNLIYIFAFFITNLAGIANNQEIIHQESPLPKDFFSQLQTRELRLLSSPDISSLYKAFSSTQDTAGTDAIALLSQIAKSQPNAITAFFNICTGITTPDANNNNATPLSVATPTVKLALSTGIISLLNDSYNYTLLHFAALFSIIGGAINPSIDTRTPAISIISTILSDLTQAQILTAITKQDMWQSTPVHYAAISKSDNQAAVIEAFLSPLTSTTNRMSVISKKNMWDFTPLHNAAVYALNATGLVASFFDGLSTTEKTAALVILDQWSATPLDYAMLSQNLAFFNPTFWANITKAQKITVLKAGKGTPLSAPVFQVRDHTSIDFSNHVFVGMSKSDIQANFPWIWLSPKFEFETIVAPSFILAQE
jgi:hypothetical protein